MKSPSDQASALEAVTNTKVRAVIEATSTVLGVPVAFILMDTRGMHSMAFARRVAMYVAGTTIPISHSELALAFRRDRSSVTAAINLIAEQFKTDDQVQRAVAAVRARVGDGGQGEEGATNQLLERRL